MIIDGWRQPPADASMPVITHVPGGDPEWAAWAVSRMGAAPVMITLLQEPQSDPLGGLGLGLAPA